MALHNKHRTLASFEAGVLISRIRGGQGLKEASVDGENALCMAEIRVGNYKSRGARGQDNHLRSRSKLPRGTFVLC